MKKASHIPNPTNGSILLAMLTFILVSFAAISLLGHVVAHQRIIKARARRADRMEPIYQELLHYLHQLKERVNNLNIQDSAEPELDIFTPEKFPDRTAGDIAITNHFSHTIDQYGSYKTIAIHDLVEAASSRHPYLFVAGFEVDILSGKIPLSLIPLYLRQHIDIPTTSFLEANNISLKSQSGAIVDDSPHTFDATAFLSGSLNIEGKMLNWQNVREQLGLEISSAPIPDGIYFFQDGRRLRTIFVQGTVRHMTLFTRHNRQFVQLEQHGTTYSFSYIPGEYAFDCWDPSLADETIFDERLIINGDCLALNQQGLAAFHPDSDLTLFVSGKTIIKSSLVAESEQLHQKKTGWTHLTIISGSHRLQTDDCGESSLIIEKEGDTILELSLMINGRATNHSRNLVLNGSLFAGQLQNNGSININHLFPQFNDDACFLTKNVTIVHKIIINYIQEIANGNK